MQGAISLSLASITKPAIEIHWSPAIQTPWPVLLLYEEELEVPPEVLEDVLEVHGSPSILGRDLERKIL